MKIRQNKAYKVVEVLAMVVLAVGSAVSQKKPQDGTSEAQVAAAAIPGGRDADTQTALPSANEKDSFVIGNEDVLAINVWKEPDISRAVPVRSDGKISLPLVGELQATGKTPKQLEADIRSGLKDYMSEPEVTVIVQEIKSQRFNILGRVARPGAYLLTPPMTVLDAIAQAGGFQDFAKSKDMYVLRRSADGSQKRLPFNYKQVIKGNHPEQNIFLEPHDTIYVP
jgi:polysaccharide biosynthesis/export protein